MMLVGVERVVGLVVAGSGVAGGVAGAGVTGDVAICLPSLKVQYCCKKTELTEGRRRKIEI
jgi:hypothetical protein